MDNNNNGDTLNTQPPPLPTNYSDTDPNHPFRTKLKPKIREKSNWLSKITFQYVTNLIRLANKVEILESDIPDLEHQDESSYLSDLIWAAWDKERASKGPTNARLWRSTAKIFWLRYFGIFLVCVLESCIKVAQAVMLGYIVRLFMNPSEPDSNGYWYAFALSLLVIWHGFLHHIMFFSTMRLGTQLRVGFISAVYRKCLKLSVGHTSSSGVIVNLISNDVQRFEETAIFLLFVLAGPIETILVLIFLWREISWAALAGMVALFALIPLQSWFAKIFGRLRRDTVIWRDERVRVISDLLAGMQLIKLYAWENPFESKIKMLRDKEMKYVKKASVLRATNEATYFFSPGTDFILFVVLLFIIVIY